MIGCYLLVYICVIDEIFERFACVDPEKDNKLVKNILSVKDFMEYFENPNKKSWFPLQQKSPKHCTWRMS